MVYERILAYIMARLDEIQDVSKKNNGGRPSSAKNDNEDNCILEAVSVLLLQKKSAESNLLLQSRDHQILLQKFVETFLLLPWDADLNEERKDNIRVPVISASTVVGRKATLLACDIILEKVMYCSNLSRSKNIRVGVIKKTWIHEEADKLFCEEIHAVCVV